MNIRAIHKPLIAAGVIMLLVAILTDPALRGLLTSHDAGAVGGYNAVDEVGQVDGGGNPVYTTGTIDNGVGTPNSQGLNLSGDLNGQGSVAVDTVNHRLFVSEGGNHRIVIFNLDANNLPANRTADYVIGQTDFVTNTAAVPPTARSLNSPWGIAYASASERLFVSDTVNNRILVFDVSPANLASDGNGTDAIYVIGKDVFDNSDDPQGNSALNTCKPKGLAYDPVGQRLFSSQSESTCGEGNSTSRVTVYDVSLANLASDGNGTDAINVLGQENFSGGATALTQDGLNLPYGLAYNIQDQMLYVADYQGARVMVFDVAAITNGEDAVSVLGQLLFTTNDVAVTQAGLSTPREVVYDSVSSRLYVAEEQIDRVMVFDVDTITNGEAAVDVYGQTGFETDTSGTTQSTLNSAGGLAFDSSGTAQLYVADQFNNRVMIFDTDAAPTPTPAPGGGGGGSSPPAGIGFTPEKIVINSDEPSVDTRNVLVAIYARFSETFVGTVDVILSNDPTFPTYTSFRYNVHDAIVDAATWPKTIGWDLCWGVPASQCVPGRHVVYARFYVNTPPPRPALTPAPLFP